jgi:hypothetical protein
LTKYYDQATTPRFQDDGTEGLLRAAIFARIKVVPCFSVEKQIDVAALRSMKKPPGDGLWRA